MSPEDRGASSSPEGKSVPGSPLGASLSFPGDIDEKELNEYEWCREGGGPAHREAQTQEPSHY